MECKYLRENSNNEEKTVIANMSQTTTIHYPLIFPVLLGNAI